MKARLFVAAATCLLIAAGCSSDSDSTEEEATTADGTVASPDAADTTPDAASDSASAYGRFAALPVACGGTAPEPPSGTQYEEAADQEIGADQTVVATVTTSCGDLVLTLDPAAAPATVNNFVFLAREGFYDGIVSHRIVPGFVLQIGDPTARGDGGPGYRFDDELPASSDEYGVGAVVMANAGPNTNGSQIFINFEDNSEILAPTFSKFGQLTGGQDVLDQIAAIPTGGPTGDTPMESLYIEGVTIEVS